jgi:hypothetical protein
MMAISALSMADLIAVMRKHVAEDMLDDDVTAQELVENLDIAWCAAERWRIEQWPVPQDDSTVVG